MPGDDLVESLQETLGNEQANSDRRTRADRRSGKPSNYAGPERRQENRERRVLPDRRKGADRRAGPDRRHAFRRIEEIEFVRAVDRYKRKFNRPFPTWSEVLAILKELGYTKDSLG